jgi:hypothetical protein
VVAVEKAGGFAAQFADIEEVSAFQRWYLEWHVSVDDHVLAALLDQFHGVRASREAALE